MATPPCRRLLYDFATALFLCTAATLAAANPVAWGCGETGKFPPNSSYERTLRLLATELPNTTASSSSLFATATHGVLPELVIAVALCRRDADPSACRGCVSAAFDDGFQLCERYKDSTVFFDLCTLRYSNENILASASSEGFGKANTYTSNSTSTTMAPLDAFDADVSSLLQQVINYTATSSSRYATGVQGTTYALAQCQPIMTAQECFSCLSYLRSRMPSYFRGKNDGTMHEWHCFFEFDNYKFFKGDPIIHVPGIPGEGKTKKRNKSVIIAIVTIPTGGFIFVLLVGSFLLIRRQKRSGKDELRLQKGPQSQNKTEATLKLWRIEESSSGFTLYEFSELAAATSNFSNENRLGSGGFGPVYKGKLQGGADIAVKRLSLCSRQGLEQFKSEIQLLVKLQHTNLVRLVGCCVHEDEKLLVYEYMANGSLDRFIFDQQQGLVLDWEKRLRIIEGIADGLLYLHKHSRVRVIHRDLKTSNILLDRDLTPKISDFGLAKIFPSNLIEANTKRVVGTFGYMAPEYASEGTFSVKSDVYSFGVLLLEVISGKRINEQNQYSGSITMLGYAWQLWSDGRASELIDPTLGMCGEEATIMQCIKVALLCVQDSATDRPTMADVTAMLAVRGGVASLPDPRRPRELSSSRALEIRTQSHPSTCSVNDVSITTMQGR